MQYAYPMEACLHHWIKKNKVRIGRSNIAITNFIFEFHCENRLPYKTLYETLLVILIMLE